MKSNSFALETGRISQLPLANTPECWLQTLSTNLLSHSGNQTNTSTKSTNIPASLDCTKGQAFQSLYSLRATMCTDKDHGSMPTGPQECKESLSCGKFAKLKQAQESFLFNAWIKHPRHTGHYCWGLWFPTAQHPSSNISLAAWSRVRCYLRQGA